MAVNSELLQILACPKCKGSLEKQESPEGLACKPCSLLYPIKEGIAIMLIEGAQPLEQSKTPE